MKLYIACDMEGTAGNVTWDEVNQEKSEYAQFREIMTKEVIGICEIAKTKFDDICIKDGHWTETNILLENLPDYCNIIRGDDGRNLTGLDSSFDALILEGYHAVGGEITYPLSHTISDDIVFEIRLNGKRIGEKTLALLNAAKYNIPIIFISGDEKAVEEALSCLPDLVGVITKKLSNTSYICKSPQKVNGEIKKALTQALSNFEEIKEKLIYRPSKFDLEIEYAKYFYAKKAANYPNSILEGKTVKFKAKDLDEFLHIINLCI